jgi:hypothetical protein
MRTGQVVDMRLRNDSGECGNREHYDGRADVDYPVPGLSARSRVAGCRPLLPRLASAVDLRRGLNRTLHIMAVVQLRNPTEGRAYYDRKVAAGQSLMEAMRSLKRRLSDIVYHQMITDALGTTLGPHALHEDEQTARHQTSRTALEPFVTCK